MRARLVVPAAIVGLVASLLIAPTSHADPASAPDVTSTLAGIRAGESALVVNRTTAIAPGLSLTSFRRLQPGGWVTGHVMDADLSTPSLGLDLADGGTVSGSNATIETFAREAKAVAAVNGDFFDMNFTDAPVGTNVSSEGVRSVSSSGRPSFTVQGGKGAVQALMSTAKLTSSAGTEAIPAVNSPGVAANTAAVFNQVWGGHSLAGLVPANEAKLRIVVVDDGVVTATTTDRAALALTGPIASGRALVVARGAAADRLSSIAVGERVELSVGTSSAVDLAVGGAEWMIKDGVVFDGDAPTAGRTAVGVSKDGTRIKVVTIDGRAGDSHGMTISELASFMHDLGVWNAINLDGGGSTTLVARPAGTDDLTLVNRPSDGNQRLDTNALVFTSTATGPVAGLDVRPVLQPAAGLERADAHHLMPGLTRTVHVTGLDANFAATPVSGGKLVSKDESVAVSLTTKPTSDTGIVRGLRTGVTTVEYFAKLTQRGAPTRDDFTLHVFGAVQRIEASTQVLALEDDTASGVITLTAIDADGNRVPVETRDVTVSSEPGVSVTTRGIDGFTVAAQAGARSSRVTFTVLGKSVEVPVTIGFDEATVTQFTPLSAWKAETARATGTLSSGTGPDGGPALALDLDFTQSTATRGMYAVPTTPIVVAGQPQAFTVWIKGTGKGEWPRLQVTKGDGTSTNLDGPLVEWTGWQQVTFPVPAGTPYPLTITALRFMEIRSTTTYTDHLEVADLVAQVPVAVDLPEPAVVADPVIVTQGTVDGAPLRIAVISDSQFVARNGADHPIVLAARRTLKEIVAASPDLVLLAGDFVDEASPADFALAKRVLDEELGSRVPWIYVPGNHEVMGGPISNFTSVFGPTSTHRVVNGTLVVTLDSSSGTLHPGGSTAQLRMLEQQLAAAAGDSTVTGVVVVNHHPVDDFQPDKASQLTDRYEAQALAQLLAQWRRDTGKSVAQVNGHVGSFHGSSDGGVSRIINGNSGKSPSGTADRGGFTGWTMLGIDPSRGVVGAAPSVPTARVAWLRAETKPRVDALTVSAPATLAVGASGDVAATITQDETRQVPVAWPVSAVWGGAAVQVGTGSDVGAVVKYSPETGVVTGLRPGTATLTVTVNGVTATTTIVVR